MTFIEGEDSLDAKALRGHSDCCVRQAKAQVGIPRHEFAAALEVLDGR
jgi:hypothetical protein